MSERNNTESALTKYVVPLGIGGALAGGTYSLLRAPIWGSKALKYIRDAYPKKSIAVVNKQMKQLSWIDKLFHGYDKLEPLSHKKSFVHPGDKYLTVNLQAAGLSEGVSHIGPLPKITGMAGMGQGILAHKMPKLFAPISGVVSATEENLLTASKLKNTVIKGLGVEASKLKKPFMASDMADAKKRKEFTDFLQSKAIKGQPGTAFYTQPYLKGDQYRLAIIDNTVVPGAGASRRGIWANILDRINPASVSKRKKVERAVQKILTKYERQGVKFRDMDDNIIPEQLAPMKDAFKSPAISKHKLFTPDVIAKFNDKGKVIDVKIIDVNSGGQGYNLYPSMDPISSQVFTRAVTGRNPKALSAIAGVAAGGAGTYGSARLLRKKRRVVSSPL